MAANVHLANLSHLKKYFWVVVTNKLESKYVLLTCV